ncbi:MAG: hypothetical protein ABF812_15875 [Gluconobacter cerinus]
MITLFFEHREAYPNDPARNWLQTVRVLRVFGFVLAKWSVK